MASNAARRVAERGVERAAALVVLAPGDRVVGAHRAAGDAVERVALRLRAERVLHDRVEDVRDPAHVGREVVEVVRPVPVLRQALARVMDAVEHLQRAGLDVGAARGARAEDVRQERPRRVGLDGRADADEGAALAEVGLEVGPLWIRQRARDARVEEHDRAVGVEVRGGELGTDISGGGGGDGVVAARRAGLDRRDARGRQRILRTRDHQHLGGFGRRRLDAAWPQPWPAAPEPCSTEPGSRFSSSCGLLLSCE